MQSSLAAHLRSLCQILVARTEWDKTNPIRDDGRAGDFLHPFLAELLELLSRISRVTDLEEVIDDVLKFPLLLFSESEIRERFLSLDVKVLEAEASSVALPPPGWVPAAVVAEQAVRLWICGIDGCDTAIET